MSGRGVLDADMATLGRWLADGWRWWIDELAAMFPARWRRSAAAALPRLGWAKGALEEHGVRIARLRGRPVTVLVPDTLCLVRRVERPAMRERDLHSLLALEGEALLPFPAGATMIGGRAVAPADARGRRTIEVAGLPAAEARAIAEAAMRAGVVANRVVLDEPGAPEPAIDFAPAMREAGILARARSAARLLWGAVVLLVVVNLAVLIRRDAASVERLERLVAEQRPAVDVARRIGGRIDRDRALAARSLALRQRQDALRGLARMSQALPEGAWLQRYAWDGATVRLAGYAPGAADMTGALRRSGGFGAVRPMSDEAQAETALGEPFDLAARVVR